MNEPSQALLQAHGAILLRDLEKENERQHSELMRKDAEAERLNSENTRLLQENKHLKAEKAALFAKQQQTEQQLTDSKAAAAMLLRELETLSGRPGVSSGSQRRPS